MIEKMLSQEQAAKMGFLWSSCCNNSRQSAQMWNP